MKTKLNLIVSAIMLINAIIYSQDYNEVIKLVASDRAQFDDFGISVSISGNYAIIGANYEDEDAIGGNTLSAAGSAYIFERNESGYWNQVQKIVPLDRNIDDFFGYSVGISGKYAIVGAYHEDEDATGGNTLADAGSAYIFERDQFGIWNQVQKIVASDRYIQDYFGYSVSISYNYAIITAGFEDEDASGGNTLTNAGSAYIFERDQTGTWNEVQKIVASDRAASDCFGNSVSISGNYAIIGAFYEDEDATGGNTMPVAGSAYIFERDPSGIWNEVQKIVASDRDAGNLFGFSVSISGNYSIIGSPYDQKDAHGANPILLAGSVYCFERNQSGDWLEKQKVVASDRLDMAMYGTSVSISGTSVAVGALIEPKDANGGVVLTDAGAAYIIERNISGNWNEKQKIVAADRDAGDGFGGSVSISGDYIVVGVIGEDEDASGGNTLTDAGSVYIFESCEADFSSDPDNIIENPNFETCILEPWSTYIHVWEDVFASTVIYNGTCVVTPYNISANPKLWHIQLLQPLSAAQIDILEQGETYTLSFDAWAEVDNMDCHVFFGQNEDPYTALLDQNIVLNTTPSTYSFDFTMTQVYPIMKLTFEIGTETTWAAFDNVRLIKQSSSSLNENNATNQISVVPNPANSYIKVFAEEGSIINFYNNLGLIMKTGVIENGRITINTDTWKKGLYIVRIQKGDSIYSRKLIIY